METSNGASQSTSVRVTPKDFFLWASAMVTLYASVGALIALLFTYIDHAFPDALAYAYYGDPYSAPIRFAIATLIVVAPTFLVLMRVIRKDINTNPGKQDLWVRKWALYLTLFVAGAMMIGDLITLVNRFLDGNLALPFLLKVVTIFAIAGGFFLHFLADLRGYWLQNPSRAKAVNYGAGAVVLLTVIAGFVIIGSPFDARLMRFDQERVASLQEIQYQIAEYWRAHQYLPPSLEDLNDPISNYRPNIADPETGATYGYEILGETKFKLCATFDLESPVTAETARAIAPYDKGLIDSWDHQAGTVCYEREIDPARYPPYPKVIE